MSAEVGVVLRTEHGLVAGKVVPQCIVFEDRDRSGVKKWWLLYTNCDTQQTDICLMTDVVVWTPSE